VPKSRKLFSPFYLNIIGPTVPDWRIAFAAYGHVAMREISAGEELTTDYALFDDHDGEMGCQCGTPSYRSAISGRDRRRPELQRKYGDYFSTYLLRRFKRSDDLR
jgi:hypothetical protein